MKPSRFGRCSRELDVNDVERGRTILTGMLVVATLGSGTATPALPEPCDMRLTIELTPDVPDPRDAGFLSSLLGNQVGYRLTPVRQVDDSTIVVELTGPGPDERCRDVVEVMRKDGRVLSIDVRQETP